MRAANKFYNKNGFIRLEKPVVETEHYACDVWYLKSL
jgi:putative acetyltransferase